MLRLIGKVTDLLSSACVSRLVTASVDVTLDTSDKAVIVDVHELSPMSASANLVP